MVREIPLTRGKVALVDDEDYERVAKFRWGVLYAKGNQCYARRATKRDGVFRNVLMHRFILDAPDGMTVDHINGDGIDNRRCNIRLATQQQNAWNSAVNADSTSGYKGVYPRSVRSFLAAIVHDGNRFDLGGFRTPEDAARVHDAAAVILRGDFAWTNFPDISPEAHAIAERVLNGGRRPRIDKKLTDDDVREIRREYAGNGRYLRELAAEYGVSIGCIGHAIRGYTFGHITDPAPLTHDKRRKAAA